MTSLSPFGQNPRNLRGFSSVDLDCMVHKNRHDLNCMKSSYHSDNVYEINLRFFTSGVMTSQTRNKSINIAILSSKFLTNETYYRKSVSSEL